MRPDKKVGEGYLRPKKHLGQHFLKDMSIIHEMMRAIEPKANDHFVEIGPGLGVLTESLCAEAGRVDAIEFDVDLLPLLNKKFAAMSNFHLHHQDALCVNYHALRLENSLRIVGNLPYQISTPLLFHVLNYAQDIQDMHFMLQKEVVDRMYAVPGNKSYGRLSVMLQYFAHVIPLFTVPPTAFNPPPRVNSQVVRILPYAPSTQACRATDFILFQNIVREAFNHRRKTLANSLKSLMKGHMFEEAGISAQARAEELSVAQYCRLANILAEEHNTSNP